MNLTVEQSQGRNFGFFWGGVGLGVNQNFRMTPHPRLKKAQNLENNSNRSNICKLLGTKEEHRPGGYIKLQPNRYNTCVLGCRKGLILYRGERVINLNSKSPPSPNQIIKMPKI